jgi:hypothetical protein
MRTRTSSATSERNRRRLMPKVDAADRSATTPVQPRQTDTVAHHRDGKGRAHAPVHSRASV